jgi:hypothetical protein
MRVILNRLGSPAMVVACVALVVALGGVSYAAVVLPKNSVGAAQLKKNAVTNTKIKKNAITSPKVKNGSLLARDFKAGQLPAGPQGPKGDTGAQGAAGVQGPAGPSHGYSTGFTDSNPVTLEADGTHHTLMSLDVPSGDYIVIARLHGITGNDGGGNSFRYQCSLAGGGATFDNPLYRVGTTNSVENYLTYEGGFTGGGPITLNCNSGNGHTLTALSGKMVAIKLGGLD